MVAAEIRPGRDGSSARDAVPGWTPARAATSRSVGVSALASSWPGAIDAFVPGITSWWSMLSNRSQLCWPSVSPIMQPSSTSSGSLKWACRRSQNASSVSIRHAIASA